MLSWFRGSVPCVAVALLAWGSIGCAVLEMPGVSCRFKSELSDPGNKKSPRNFFVRFEGKGSKTPRNAAFESQLRVRAPHDSHVRYEVDPSRLQETDGSRACIEIDDLSDDTSQIDFFAVICGQYQAPSPGPEGVNYFVNWNGVSGQELFAPGQRFIEMEVTWNGTTLTFWGLNGVVLTKVDEDTFMNTGDTFVGTGVVGLGKKARINLVKLGSGSNGPIDGGASALAKVVDAIGLASWDLFDAHYELNGPTIDFDAANNALANAEDGFTMARNLLSGLPETRTTKKVDKDLIKAEKQAGKARVQVLKTKQKSAIKKVEKSFKFSSRAVNRLSPILFAQ
jgi:hypothetical protein